MTAMPWLAGGMSDPDDPSDTLATIRAEDAFNASGHLYRVTPPTLVVGGSRDGFYSPGIFRETAQVEILRFLSQTSTSTQSSTTR